MRRQFLLCCWLLVAPSLTSAEPGPVTKPLHLLADLRTHHLSTMAARPADRLGWRVGVSGGYASNPLQTGSGHLISRRVMALVQGAWVIDRHFDLGVVLPVTLFQEGDLAGSDVANFQIKDTWGVGDLRLMPRAILYAAEDGAGLSIAAAVDLQVPTGDQADYRGSGWRAEPKLALGYGLGAVNLGGNVGYRFQADQAWQNYEANEVLTWSAAGEISVGASVWLVPEISGETAVVNVEIDQTRPIDAGLGVKWMTDRLTILAGYSHPIQGAIGVPDWRAFVGFSLQAAAPTAAPVVDLDLDQDGIPNDVDRCPSIPETINGDRDQDGCPDLDTDQDGLPDARDVCPNQAEDLDGVEDGDGCPDTRR